MATSDQDALRRFCTAQCEFAHLRDTNASDKRRISKGASMCKDLIKKRMINEGLEVVPITLEGKQMYAHLRKHSKSPTITTDVVLDAIRVMQFDTNTSSISSMAEWVENAIVKHMEMSHTDDGARLALSITTKRPDAYDATRRPHPLAASQIQEVADSLSENRSGARKLKERIAPKMNELKQTIKTTEETVAQHLQQYDPSTGTRRLRLVSNGSEETFFLRRRSNVRKKRPTVRTTVPAVKRIVSNLVIQSGYNGPPTWDALRWLQSDETMRMLGARVDAALEDLSKTTETVGVSLDRLT